MNKYIIILVDGYKDMFNEKGDFQKQKLLISHSELDTCGYFLSENPLLTIFFLTLSNEKPAK